MDGICLVYTPHSTLYTPRFTLFTLQSAFHTLDSILRSPHSTLYTPSFHALHCALYTPHSTFHTPHCTLCTTAPHSTLYTPHFTVHALHSTFHTLHFTLYTPRIPPEALQSPVWQPALCLHIMDFDVVQLFQKIYHALGHARLLPHHVRGLLARSLQGASWQDLNRSLCNVSVQDLLVTSPIQAL